jgi:hypothetical protein
MGEYVDQFSPDGGDGGLVCKRAVVDLLADWQLCAPISGVRVNDEVIADVMALPAAPMGDAASVGVKVKPLVWRDGEVAGRYYNAATILGDAYLLRVTELDSPRWCFGHMGQWYNADSVEDAKAAAQANYEARILSALTPSPASTLGDALELPEIKALVEAATNLRKNIDQASLVRNPSGIKLRADFDAALAALQKGGAE